MVNSFVGGVRDAQGRRGFVQLAGAEIVAVDLATGAVLWRRARIGRPVAATLERLLTLDKPLALRVVDAATGADAGRIELPGLPDWAAATDLAPDAVQVAASEQAGRIRLQWSVRRPYRGGAPPTAQISAQAAQAATGAAVVDLATLAAEPQSAPGPEPAAAAAAASAREQSPEQSPDPHVFALDRVGDRLFALKTQEGTPGVTLEASNANDRTVLWQVPLTTQNAPGPRPLRK